MYTIHRFAKAVYTLSSLAFVDPGTLIGVLAGSFNHKSVM